MKITIEIPDEEIREAVKDAVVRDIVREAAQEVKNWTFPERGLSQSGDMTHFIYSDIRRATREILREHLDEITAQAVDAAATTIANKGLKKLLEKELVENGG